MNSHTGTEWTVLATANNPIIAAGRAYSADPKLAKEDLETFCRKRRPDDSPTNYRKWPGPVSDFGKHTYLAARRG